MKVSIQNIYVQNILTFDSSKYVIPSCWINDFFHLAQTVCISWRQTGKCNPNGPREPHNDKPCDASIPNDLSGFCQCRGGTKQMMKWCWEKGEYRNCNEACKHALIYQHDAQGTIEPNSIFLFIQKYRNVHLWDNNIHYILHHFKACHSTIEMSIFIHIVRNIIWDRIRFRKNIFGILEISSCTYRYTQLFLYIPII